MIVAQKDVNAIVCHIRRNIIQYNTKFQKKNDTFPADNFSKLHSFKSKKLLLQNHLSMDDDTLSRLIQRDPAAIIHP